MAGFFFINNSRSCVSVNLFTFRQTNYLIGECAGGGLENPATLFLKCKCAFHFPQEKCLWLNTEQYLFPVGNLETICFRNFKRTNSQQLMKLILFSLIADVYIYRWLLLTWPICMNLKKVPNTKTHQFCNLIKATNWSQFFIYYLRHTQ